MSQKGRLRNSAEFRAVYELGKRYDGRLMTAFVLSQSLDQHRLGITASRKLSKNAVDRNRAKRLLRETFRLSASEVADLQRTYDWVLNARRSLLEVKVNAAVEEFKGILARVKKDEPTSPEKASKEL